jgi:hypothetical protein
MTPDNRGRQRDEILAEVRRRDPRHVPRGRIVTRPGAASVWYARLVRVHRSHLVLLLFAGCAIGAQDCWSFGSAGTSGAGGGGTSVVWCYTDPPVGCVATCVAGFTGFYGCDGPASGPVFQMFKDAIQARIDALGSDPCAGRTGGALTPCQLGITPVEAPDQDHLVCTRAVPCMLGGC